MISEEPRPKEEVRTFHGSYPVYYEDTDFTGYVFHPNFLKFCDRAREDIFGLRELRQLYAEGKHFVVRKASLNFLKPATHGQILAIASTVRVSRSPLLHFAHTISCDETKELICEVEVELVSINEKGKPVRLPERVFVHLKGSLQRPSDQACREPDHRLHGR